MLPHDRCLSVCVCVCVCVHPECPKSQHGSITGVPTRLPDPLLVLMSVSREPEPTLIWLCLLNESFNCSLLKLHLHTSSNEVNKSGCERKLDETHGKHTHTQPTRSHTHTHTHTPLSSDICQTHTHTNTNYPHTT